MRSDTGADGLSSNGRLPRPRPFLFPFYTGVSHPFSGMRRSVTFYGARVEVDGKVYNAIVEPVTERERLIGRDILNQMKVTFDGPSRLTTVD
jgi:hypothetical protein